MRLTILTFAFLFLRLTFVGAEEKPAKIELSKDEQAILDLTNKARAAEKLPPLTIDATLLKVARAHTENMAKQEKAAHELDGKKPSDRAKAAGYDYALVGENIAAADGVTPDVIVNGWLNSKPHRANLMEPKFTEIGIGVVKNAKGETYYTQVFGTPRKKK